MGERVVKLHGRPSFPDPTAGNQPIFTPAAERGSLKPPAAAYLAKTETELQASSSPTRDDDRIKAPPGPHDLEKGLFRRHPQPAVTRSCIHSTVAYADSEADGHETGAKEHAVWILIYLSALSPLLAVPIALYTFLVSMLLLLLLPLCLCLKRLPICAHFHQSLLPLLGFQLRLIYSFHDSSDPVRSETYSIMVLILASIISPLYSMAIAVATWVAGVFWFYTAILGDPDGKEDRDDGREAVLAVRGWWERWLIQSLEPADNFRLRDSECDSGFKG